MYACAHVDRLLFARRRDRNRRAAAACYRKRNRNLRRVRHRLAHSRRVRRKHAHLRRVVGEGRVWRTHRARSARSRHHSGCGRCGLQLRRRYKKCIWIRVCRRKYSSARLQLLIWANNGKQSKINASIIYWLQLASRFSENNYKKFFMQWQANLIRVFAYYLKLLCIKNTVYPKPIIFYLLIPFSVLSIWSQILTNYIEVNFLK